LRFVSQVWILITQYLIVLTDLWGQEKFDWFLKYQEKLNAEVVVYDSCKIANVDKTIYKESNLHQQFVNGGIEKAVTKLLEQEQKEVNILAFSIGGTIAWKAIQKGLKVNNLFAVSATRLRYETEKPNCNIHLFYGEKDVFKPKQKWFQQFELELIEIKNKGHEVYKDEMFFKNLVAIINNY